jgi:hypothetical protein
MSKQYLLTQEQLALAAERKAKRQKKAEVSTPESQETGIILEREWMQLHAPQANCVKVLTWNVCSFFLAQIRHAVIEMITSYLHNVSFVCGASRDMKFSFHSFKRT